MSNNKSALPAHEIEQCALIPPSREEERGGNFAQVLGFGRLLPKNFRGN